MELDRGFHVKLSYKQIRAKTEQGTKSVKIYVAFTQYTFLLFLDARFELVGFCGLRTFCAGMFHHGVVNCGIVLKDKSIQGK